MPLPSARFFSHSVSTLTSAPSVWPIFTSMCPNPPGPTIATLLEWFRISVGLSTARPLCPHSLDHFMFNRVFAEDFPLQPLNILWHKKRAHEKAASVNQLESFGWLLER